MIVEFVYGGSFDPLHKGHINLVKQVISNIKQLNSGSYKIQFRFLPCATPALKKKTYNSFVERSKKLRSTFTNYFIEQNIEMLVDEREGNRNVNTSSYTIDSLRELEAENKNNNLSITRFLIIGADNFNGLARWKEYQLLSNYCNLLVINRPNESLNDWLVKAKEYQFCPQPENTHLLDLTENCVGSCYYMEIPEINISSTEIRERMKNNQSVDKWLM
ncbi:MAG: nicotinate-nicotinamide nucleotide adenylyltransferase [Kangiellaceae bacterium]